ncbi:hypothetical protein BCEP4_220184 [Burkholderia cepacia]|nr:hypothetical protein BCEP4_220184 [Burkholderia cepacia]
MANMVINATSDPAMLNPFRKDSLRCEGMIFIL